MISVVIPTYNGAHKIINTLDSLKKQSTNAFELIVVIDGSTDNTAELLAYLKDSLPFECKIIDQQKTGRGGVRNSGIKHAKFDVLLFLDDDIRLERKAIEKHIKHHSNFTHSILTGSAIEDHKKTATDFLKYRRYLSEKWTKPFTSSFPYLLDESMIFATAAHLSISKNDFLKIGQFNPQLSDGEDIEFAKRAFNLHYKLYVDLSIIGWHDDLPSCQSFIRRQIDYAKVANKSFSNLTFILRILSWEIWIWLIDTFNVFKIFPKKIRYRFYDAIIQANIIKAFRSKHQYR